MRRAFASLPHPEAVARNVEARGAEGSVADFIEGLAPEGVSTVTIGLANVHAEQVAVHDNVYTLASDSTIRSVEVDVTGARIVLQL